MNWDTISRKALLKEFSSKCCGECCICIERDNESGECGLIKWIEPTDEIVLYIGYWELHSDGYRCSHCGIVHKDYTSYCPSCGAKMRYRR